MKQSINLMLKRVAENSTPSREDFVLIEHSLKKFLKKFEINLKKLKIKAEVFVGGSYAKNTMIKKDEYDIDIFVRFENGRGVSELTRKALKSFDFKIIHGSRDYFQIKAGENLVFEIIPVKKITKPKEAENITDLSYSHVKYIKKKIKMKKLLDEIRLAKVFCYSNGFYGAESYVNGFSGYALELLVYYYKGFLKFIQAMAKAKEKIIIDIEKNYKNKYQVMMDINSSKLKSPIVLIDPTYKQRNAAAALSDETFLKFQKICREFLKNPSIKAFETQKVNFEKIKKDADKKGFEFILLEAKTNRQEGDIAGSKLLKFYRHLKLEIDKYFEIKKDIFDYGGGKTAKYFFIVKSKREILHSGPMINDVDNVKKFRKEHAKAFIKNHKVYARERINFSIKEFINKWKKNNNRKIKEMGITELKI